jgi:hypothetical protein
MALGVRLVPRGLVPDQVVSVVPDTPRAGGHSRAVTDTHNPYECRQSGDTKLVPKLECPGTPAKYSNPPLDSDQRHYLSPS